MYKIKLLILLLLSLTFASCTNQKKPNEIKLSVDYIGSEYDGYLLSNKLKGYLNNYGMLNNRSNYQIQASISHVGDLFITNIDNTSDREKIISTIELKIYNETNKCFTFFYNESISQFYVLAASDRFSSNKLAVEEIKNSNTEYFVKNFINSLGPDSLICNE